MEIRINNEYANLVPTLTREEYESLKESIKQNGLYVPIAVNNQGVVLDGHHRFKACQELGISQKELKIEIKKFKNKLEEKLFVIDCNLTRRHLTSFQRTELALKSKPILEDIARKNSESNLKQNQDKTSTDKCLSLGRVNEEVGKRAGVSYETVRKVENIIKNAPEEVKEELRTDQISINQAHESIVKEERRKQLDKNNDNKQYQKPIKPLTPFYKGQEEKYVAKSDEVIESVRELVLYLSGMKSYSQMYEVSNGVRRQLVEKQNNTDSILSNN